MELFDTLNTPLLLTQWKAYTPIQKIKDFIEVLAAHPNFEGKHYLLALPQTHLKELSACKLPPEFILGAKSIDSVKEGTFTESIAATILKKVGANFVLVGSHESRQVFKETDESINKKIHRLLNEKLQPVLCIGETLKDAQGGHNVDLLIDQIKNGLEGLTEEQKGQLVIFYEAPWLITTPKKLTLDDTLEAYEECRQALRQALGEVLFDKLRIIYALPEESIDLSGLVKHTSQTSFSSVKPDDILPLLDQIISPPSVSFGHEEHAHKEKIFSEAKPTEQESPISKQISPQPHVKHPIEQISAPSEKKEKEEEEIKEKVAKKQVSTPEEEIEIEKIEAEKVEAGGTSKNVSIGDKSELEKETQSIVKEVVPELHAEKAGAIEKPSEVFSGIKEEEKGKEVEAELAAALEKTTLPLEKVSPLDVQIQEEEKITRTDFSAEDLMLEISALNSDQKELDTIYTSMQEKAVSLNQLRKDYSVMSERATQALNLLDQDLRQHISQRDDEYFKSHPEKLEAANPAFGLIDQLNEIIQTADAIPKEVDRLGVRGKELREKLQKEWDDLNSHRQEIKKAHPDIIFPSQPKTLLSPPPKIDLSFPAFEGASPLVQKNIGVVPIEQVILEPQKPEPLEEPIHERHAEKAVTFPQPPMLQQPPKTEGHVDIQEKIEELQARADSMLKANEALGECYKKIKDLSERLPYLRTQFPDLLSKMTADLNKLDPFLQEKINTGNVSYFSENPEKAKEASVVLIQLQNLSQLFQETAAIPRDVDRLLSKGRELRKDLETEWTYFRINKRKIKEKFPDFSFPAQPSQLLVGEPVVDLTPKDSPPATLGSKRFAVVKAPPIKK